MTMSTSRDSPVSRRSIDVTLVVTQLSLLIAIFAHPSAGFVTYPQLVDFVGPVLFVSGIVIGVLGIVGLRKSLSIFPTPGKHASLVKSGVYKYIRHPMYTGLILVALSFTICRVSLLGIALFVGLVALLLLKSSYEERLLLKRFNEYETYRQKTGRFFVKL